MLTPFMFQAAWLTHKDVSKVVQSISRNDSQFTDNIPTVSAALAQWNTCTFGNIHRKKKMILARLGGVQSRLASPCHGGLVKLEKKLMDEYQDILYQEELLWFQRSREEWITSGDRNTTYYHASTTIRKARNSVTSLHDDSGSWISNAVLLKQHVRDYFVNLFTGESEPCHPYIGGGSFPRISSDQWCEFNRAISKDEVHTALMDMALFKAPGPDGLHDVFY